VKILQIGARTTTDVREDQKSGRSEMHGLLAPQECRQRADNLAAAGDSNGEAVWEALGGRRRERAAAGCSWFAKLGHKPTEYRGIVTSVPGRTLSERPPLQRAGAIVGINPFSPAPYLQEPTLHLKLI